MTQAAASRGGNLRAEAAVGAIGAASIGSSIVLGAGVEEGAWP